MLHGRAKRSRIPWASGVVIALALVGPAHAGNMVHPRTPVLWPDSPCIVSVDRASDPVLEFGYAIPFEDTKLSTDELEDSRTHQFIGFCRQWPAGTSPPPYVSVADLERAIDNDSEPDTSLLVDPEATLETSVEWADCWTRVTLDDARRPITFAAAAEPVVWDTSAVAAGTWVIAGYTWEPPYNLWRRAPWVARVYDDDSDPTLIQPAAAVGTTPEVLWENELLELDLCVAADPAATVRLAWAITEDDPLVWHEGDPTPTADATQMTVPFMAPTEAWGFTMLLRARVEGETGSDYASYPLAPIIVIHPGGVDDGGDGDDTGTSDSGTSDTDSETDSGEGVDAETDETGQVEANGSDDACNCSTDPARGNLAMLSFGSFILLSIRRRSSRGSN